ncbi:MAG: hypothetical protein NTZ05_00450, partial [Chloroflexi bacterium]|nr:hypothetical protein [Chloroflexota bacterium]
GLWVDVFGAADRVYGIPDEASELILVDSSLVQRADALPGEVINLPGGQQAKRTPLPPVRGRHLVWRAPGPDRPRGALGLAQP